MRKKICKKCGEEFPLRQTIDGEVKELYSRKLCLGCSPFKSGIKNKICKKCGQVFQGRKMIDGEMKEIYKRKICLECAPIGDINGLYHKKLTDIQEQVLYGHLLGDGCLHIHKKHINAHFCLSRKTEDKLYLDWSASYFQEYLTKRGVASSERYRKEWGITIYESRFDTMALPIFTEYYHKWYPEDKKIVPPDLVLTPLMMAVWFADDGTITHATPTALQANFATHCFSYEDVVFLKNQIVELCGAKINIYSSTRNKNNYTLSITDTTSCKKIFRVIDGIFPLDRKSIYWRTEEIDLWSEDPTSSIPCIFCGSDNTKKKGINHYNQREYFCNNCKKYYKSLNDYVYNHKTPEAVRKLFNNKYDL